MALLGAICSVACTGEDPIAVNENGDGGASSSSGTSGSTSGTSGTGAAKNRGDHCNEGDNCVGSICVDGFCCESACTDTCSACDVGGKEGTCAPVTGKPHGTKRACLGSADGACAGTCDGSNTKACVYPTEACGAAPSCTSGVGTPAGKCDQGICKQVTESCADKLCGASSCLTVLQVVTGFDFGCALLSDQTVRCWGHNNRGQLGQGGTDVADRVTPTPVPGLTSVTALGAGSQHVCAIVANGTVKCWGANYSHQLGLGDVNAANDNVAHPTPTEVCKTGTGASCVPLTGASVVAGGPENTCAVVGTSVYCWGYNNDGQLGCGSCNPTNANPQVVCGPNACPPTNHLGDTGGAIIQLAMGWDFSCALNGTNDVYCWGSNNSGVLGQNPDTVFNKTQPVAVLNLAVGAKKPIAIAASSYTVCAIVSDGTTSENLVRCWGNGTKGERGNDQSGSSAYGSSPVTVCASAGCATSFKGATSIAGGGGGPSGAEAFCAVSGGAVSCWGDNQIGELGIGSVTPALSKVATASGVTAGALDVAAGTEGPLCARLSAGGTLRCWGANGYGQIGAGAVTPNPQPTPTAQIW
jgi:alpha-tubulin suppressor-like RCC1 family protein